MGITNTRTNKGFTIVELLIVIVVIAILAAITIVSYNGVSSRARQSILQNDLQSTAKLIENYKTTTGAYPNSLGQLNNGQGVTTGNGSIYAYTTGGGNYQLTIGSTQYAERFRISNTTGSIEVGTWPGHEGIFAGFPSRGGYTDITNSYGTGDTFLASIGSVPTGAWMIVVLCYWPNENPTPPAGWTTLVLRKTTNTMQTSIFAKIKQAGDDDNQEFQASGTNGIANGNAAFAWGTNAAPVSAWTLGAFGDRANNATSTTVVTPTITTTAANSLVLSIATERTNSDETNYVSLTGATPWVWIPQPTGDLAKNQTIAIGYNEQANVGTSQAMTVTYPNAMTTNGTGIQIGIPPAS